MPEAPWRDPPQPTRTCDGPERGADEAGACRAVRVIDASFHSEGNEIMLRFERAALLSLRHKITDCRKGNNVQGHTPYPVSVFDCHGNTDDWWIKVEPQMLQAQCTQLASENCAISCD